MNEYFGLCCILARIVKVEPPKDAESSKAWFRELKASGVLDWNWKKGNVNET